MESAIMYVFTSCKLLSMNDKTLVNLDMKSGKLELEGLYRFPTKNSSPPNEHQANTDSTASDTK